MRRYNPNPKREIPWLRGRKATRLDLSIPEATQLLNDGVRCIPVPGKRQLVAVKGKAIYVFFDDNAGGYHAVRVSGNEIHTKFSAVQKQVAAMLGIRDTKLHQSHDHGQ